MGRLSKITPNGRHTGDIKVHYRKLVDEFSGSCESFQIMPELPDFFSYSCHQCGHMQKLQAEELNSIVGNAFRMAYAAQLQKQPTFQDVIASQLDQTQTDKVLWTKELSAALKKDKSALHRDAREMDVQQHRSTDASRLDGSRVAPPNTIPGLQPAHKYNVLGPTSEKSQSQQSTPSSDESNSPTEMNSYKRMTEKPPLIKRIAMGLTGNSILTNDDDSCPLVSDGNTSSTPGSPTNISLTVSYVNEKEEAKNKTNHADNLRNEIVENINANLLKHIDNIEHTILNKESIKLNKDFSKNSNCKRTSQLSSSSSGSGIQGEHQIIVGLSAPKAPPLPERTDSLNNKEYGELRLAPWFQAGIPREIALEILAQEPIGSFMVRESTTKSGCFALSLRVPRNFQATGIAHYLIVRTNNNKGFKIKGFTKEFSTLASLITHHSVMPELLPCPLSLSRYHPNFAKSDSKRDFADIDLDPDYNTLADFRKMMADLNV